MARMTGQISLAFVAVTNFAPSFLSDYKFDEKAVSNNVNFYCGKCIVTKHGGLLSYEIRNQNCPHPCQATLPKRSIKKIIKYAAQMY